MSKFMGIVKQREAAPGYLEGAHTVHVSLGGVELYSDPVVTLTPLEARVFAAYLTTAADEVDQMRRREASCYDVPLAEIEATVVELQDVVRRRKEGK
jgi:hypothetical protein